MPFVRTKVIYGHTYYYLVYNYRIGKRVHQRVIRYLGKHPPATMAETRPSVSVVLPPPDAESRVVGETRRIVANHANAMAFFEGLDMDYLRPLLRSKKHAERVDDALKMVAKELNKGPALAKRLRARRPLGRKTVLSEPTIKPRASRARPQPRTAVAVADEVQRNVANFFNATVSLDNLDKKYLSRTTGERAVLVNNDLRAATVNLNRGPALAKKLRLRNNKRG